MVKFKFVVGVANCFLACAAAAALEAANRCLSQTGNKTPFSLVNSEMFTLYFEESEECHD